jgi:hypothetical protein
MVKLPIKTSFCEDVIPLGFEDLSFYVDGNSKITASNGTYAEPRPNAFSLPAASVEWDEPMRSAVIALPSCPGSTPTCRASCYVKGLAAHAPALYARYRENARVLDRVLGDRRAEIESAVALAAWARCWALGGFRWHVSGDVRDRAHAEWIALVCTFAPDVPFWIYTRTLDVVEVLAPVENLAVNISADRDNYAEACEAADATGARVCYLASGPNDLPILPGGSVIFPDYPLRGRELSAPTSHPWWTELTQRDRAMVCPTDFFGQSEAHRCGPCRKCLDK